MSDFKVPQGATHFVSETDDFRAHFIQVDDAGNVLAELVPSVHYIGWDFDIDPYPMLTDSIPVSAYKELTTLRQQNSALLKDRNDAVSLMSKSWQCNHEKFDDLLTRYVAMAVGQIEMLEKQNAELVEALELCRVFVDSQFEQKISSHNPVYVGRKIANVLSKIKGDKDA